MHGGNPEKKERLSTSLGPRACHPGAPRQHREHSCRDPPSQAAMAEQHGRTAALLPHTASATLWARPCHSLWPAAEVNTCSGQLSLQLHCWDQVCCLPQQDSSHQSLWVPDPQLYTVEEWAQPHTKGKPEWGAPHWLGCMQVWDRGLSRTLPQRTAVPVVPATPGT